MAECGPQPPGAGGGGGGGGGGGSGGAGAPSRHEKSLGLLTTKFVSLLQEAKDGVLDLKLVRGRRRLGRPGRGHCCMRGGRNVGRAGRTLGLLSCRRPAAAARPALCVCLLVWPSGSFPVRQRGLLHRALQAEGRQPWAAPPPAQVVRSGCGGALGECTLFQDLDKGTLPVWYVQHLKPSLFCM